MLGLILYGVGVAIVVVAGLGVEDRSALDYIYFGTIDLSNVTFKVNNTYESWFRIDNTSGHLETYGVTNLTFT